MSLLREINQISQWLSPNQRRAVPFGCDLLAQQHHVVPNFSWVHSLPEQVGGYTENPVEAGINDVSMSARCQMIEIEQKERLQEANLHQPVQPIEGILL